MKQLSLFYLGIVSAILILLLMIYLIGVFKNNISLQINAKPIESKPALTKEQFIKLVPNEQYDYLTRLADQSELQKVWQFINESYQNTNTTSGPVHDLAHFVGGLIYEKQGFEGLNICTPNFAFGCFHGFLDSAFKESLEDLSKAEDACSRLAPGLSGPVASCIHGIGHGIASYYQVRNLKDALNACDRIQKGQQYCYDGVFMEFARSAPPSFYKESELLYPCSTLDEQYARSCARNQVRVMLERFKQNFTQVVDICKISSSNGFKDGCFEALGFEASAQAKGDPKIAVQICETHEDSEFRSACKIAAAGEWVFQNLPNWRQDSDFICKSMDGENQNKCLEKNQIIAREYSR